MTNSKVTDEWVQQWQDRRTPPLTFWQAIRILFTRSTK